MPKFCTSIYCLTRLIESGAWTPEQAYRRLAEMGSEGVEIVPFGFDPSTDEALCERLNQTAIETNVPIVNYSLNANFLLISDEEYQEQMVRAKRHMKAAHMLHSPTMRVDSAAFRRPIQENTIENFQKEVPVIIHAYEELCDEASKYGMTILMENHGFHANGSERVREILTSVNRDNFGHQLDVGNYICVDDIPEIATKKMIPFAKTIHMKDFYVRPEHRNPGDAAQFKCENSWFRSSNGRYLRGSILGQGDLDIWDIMHTVKASSFDGNIILEYEGMEECEYATQVSLDNMKRIYSEV